MPTRYLEDGVTAGEMYSELYDILDESEELGTEESIELLGEKGLTVSIDGHEYRVGANTVETKSWLSKEPGTTLYEVQRYLIENTNNTTPEEPLLPALSEDIEEHNGEI